MRIMAQPPFPHLNVESRTQMTECKVLQNTRGFFAGLSVYFFVQHCDGEMGVHENEIVCFANPRLVCRHRTHKKHHTGVCTKKLVDIFLWLS